MFISVKYKISYLSLRYITNKIVMYYCVNSTFLENSYLVSLKIPSFSGTKHKRINVFMENMNNRITYDEIKKNLTFG